MTYPPEVETTEARRDSNAQPIAIRMLLTAVLAGGVIFGLCQIFIATDKAAGWAIFAAIAGAGIQGFNYCTSSSPRDNDGGSSPNQDASSGFD